MKFSLATLVLYILGSVLFSESKAQSQYIPYDSLPGLILSYKPAFDPDFPDCAKLLYSSPLNYNQVCGAFRTYLNLHPDEESAIIRYFRMWARAAEPYAQNDGSILLPDFNQYNRNLREAQLNAAKSSTNTGKSAANWSFVGPKQTFWLNESGSSQAPGSCPWQVNVYSFDVASSDDNTLYCGTETGFVNKTTDKGLNWQQLGLNYPFGGSVTAVAIHPTDANIVYVAAGNQIHKTVDGGISWIPLLPAGTLFTADRLKIDPLDPQKLFAATSGGLFVSTNSGSSWQQKWNAPVYDVEVSPVNSLSIFALTKASGKFSVIYSSDGGLTFNVQSGFPTNIVESSGGLLAMTPANPNLMLAILLSSNNKPYLLKGVLSGSAWTWSLLATGGTATFPMDNGQGYFDLVLDISPLNQQLFFVGTTTLYKSANGGTTFTAIGGYTGGFSIHPDIQDIKMLPSGETWVSTDGGMNLTTDNFSTQSGHLVRINGIVGSDLWGFDQGWNEDLLVGGRYHNGNTAMADFYGDKALRMGGAESPTGWVLQGKSRHVAFNDLGNGWILPQTAEGEPEGRFIFSKYPNMEEYGGRRSNLLHHPNYYGTLYLGESSGFWKSTDMGVTWDLLHDFITPVRYLQISYSNPDVIYADISGVGLCRSSNGGVSWTPKPSLTSPPNGSSSWKGNLFFAVSPTNENVLYACLQNGTWSANIGKIFKSTDGGDSWTELTGNLQEYMKCIVVQPDSDGNDIVYLFTNNTNGKPAMVYYRNQSMTEWASFGSGYPSGMHVNMAFPFFRDGKLRSGGNCGAWESPMEDIGYAPIVNPWVEKQLVECVSDTLYFDDHSILNHSGASWHWDISPTPLWIENSDMRNPRVVMGVPGTYDVTLTITQNGQQYSKSIPGMVTVTECPSIYNCDHPAELPKDNWSLVYVDSEEVNYPGYATMSFDNDPETIWHTRWSTGDDPYPHEIQVNLGDRYRLNKFTYLTRQDGENGRIKNYRLYISEDSLNWGDAVSTGSFTNTSAPQIITFDSVETGRYFRLQALSEVNGNSWASAAEFSLTGCLSSHLGTPDKLIPENLQAFPIPTDGLISITIPAGRDFRYSLFSAQGRRIENGNTGITDGRFTIDLGNQPAGTYMVMLEDSNGTVYRVKLVRK